MYSSEFPLLEGPGSSWQAVPISRGDGETEAAHSELRSFSPATQDHHLLLTS